ncbi:MAG: serine--tRNA ligase [Cytophagales bacterium]|jgi:seryl-tRNA synthetase|nr:serine--tRNA ligase [Cytophagales bacterium]
MFELNFLEVQYEKIIQGLQNRGYENAKELVDEALSCNSIRKKLKKEFDAISTELNRISKKIEIEMRNLGAVDIFIEESKELKENLKKVKSDLSECEEKLKRALYNIPNVPAENCPIGKDSKDNKVIFSSEIPVAKFKVPHWELIKDFDIIDFPLGTTLTGAGFPVYKGKGAQLQRALINFFLDEGNKNGAKEFEVPILVNIDSLYATGQLPDKEEQLYFATGDFGLIPTAEVPLTNMYRYKIVREEELPIKLTGFSPCFRREAGSWGANVRGLNRLHQFDKVELVIISDPKDSYKILDEMRAYVEGLVQKLELPYRVLALCTGDIGYNAAFTYDIEVFSVGQEMWLEASSISNFITYQSNRLQLKYRDKKGELRLVHTLNGSALALPRIVAALLELNFDGEKINIPRVLQSYTRFDCIKKNSWN